MPKKILLGVSGGIAAYKACELVRAFVKRGDQVRVVMTAGAREFVQPLTLQVLSENPVGTVTFDAAYESEIGHIDLARWADVVLLAPATANLIARMAAGMADDLLTTVLLATEAPVVVAPAMNTQMWRHPAVQQNLETLADRPGHIVVDPDEGELACKEVGPGRLPDPPALLASVDRAAADPILAGKKVLVTAGPTREFIDPARFISNPSTGKMGQAVAAAAYEFGAHVTLVRGPVDLDPPFGVNVVDVISARQMHGTVLDRAEEMDFVVKAAAVADWRPADESERKVTKTEMDGTLEMVRNPDILADLGARFGTGGSEKGPFLVGFGAESHDVVERAGAKRERKGAHLLVANKIGGRTGTFGSDDAAIWIIGPHGAEAFPRDSKENLAKKIWRAVVEERKNW